MALGGSTWAHQPGEDVTDTELPTGTTFSVTTMPAHPAPPPAPTAKQLKLQREVPGPTREDSE